MVMLPVAVNVPGDCAITTGTLPATPKNKSGKTELNFMSNLQISLYGDRDFVA
jgi:hypothetical protein